jgi:hypothetical protein
MRFRGDAVQAVPPRTVGRAPKLAGQEPLVRIERPADRVRLHLSVQTSSGVRSSVTHPHLASRRAEAEAVSGSTRRRPSVRVATETAAAAPTTPRAFKEWALADVGCAYKGDARGRWV